MNNDFMRLFSDHSPELRVKFRESDRDFRTVRVQHRLGSKPTTDSADFLDSLREHRGVEAFCDFYDRHDGAEICRTFHARHREDRPLLELMSAKRIQEFTSRYLPGGEFDWTMDLNKSKSLYRSSASWIAFAEINTGPACLTMFLDGPNAGCIYYATPQPPFNILRPIAQDFSGLLTRIAKDLAAFLRLVRATVVLRGVDGDNYGYMPVEYSRSIERREVEK